MKQQILFKSKLALYSNAIFKLEVFFAPAMVAFYLNYTSVTFGQMSIFFSVVLMFSIILEMPTGVFSDWFGRKRTFICGKLIYLVSMIMLLFIHDFYSLLFIGFLFALGNSLSSGNLHSLIMENILQADLEKESFFKIDSKANSIGFVVSGVAAVIGGYLGTVNLLIPLIVDIVFLSILIIICSLIIDENKTVRKEFKKAEERLFEKIANSFQTLFYILRDGLREIVTNPYIMFLFVFGAVSFGVMRTGFNFYQPMLENLNVNLGLFGWVLFLFNIISAASSYIASRMSKRFINGSGFVFITIVLMVVTGGLILFVPFEVLVVISALAMQQIIRGCVDSYTNYSINKVLPIHSKSRTTVLSAGLFVKAAVASLMMSFIGSLTERFGLNVGMITLSLGGGIIILMSYSLYLFNQQKKLQHGMTENNHELR